MFNRDRLLAALAAALTAFLGALLGTGTVFMAAGGCQNVPIPKPPEPDPNAGTLDPWNAIGKLTFSGGYCSATVVGPRLPDGRWVLVSAAHCFDRVGDTGTFVQRSGTSRPVRVVAIDKKADIVILHTDHGQGGMAFTNIASGTPPPGSKVFHGGFGRHIPGNREDGEVASLPNNSNQVKYRLSVSPGDSGGGICMTEEGKLLSPVCCTTRLDGPGEVWGGSPERISQMITTPTEFIPLEPWPMPTVGPDGPVLPMPGPPKTEKGPKPKEKS